MSIQVDADPIVPYSNSTRLRDAPGPIVQQGVGRHLQEVNRSPKLSPVAP